MSVVPYQETWPPVDRRELVEAWIKVGTVYGPIGLLPRDFTQVCELRLIGDRWVAVPRFGFPRALRN